MPDRAYYLAEEKVQRIYVKRWMIGSGVLLAVSLAAALTFRLGGQELLRSWKPYEIARLVALCELAGLVGVVVLAFSIIGWKNIADSDAQYESHLSRELDSPGHRALVDANMRRERRRLSHWLGFGFWK